MSKNKFEQLIADHLKDFEVADPSENSDEVAPKAAATRRIKSAKWIPIDRIHPDPKQPRKQFKESSLAELAQSIKEYGIRQPIVVEHVEAQDLYQIVSGERRYRASQMIKLQEMPCIVQEKATQPVRFAQQLIENIHREDFSPIDKARALLEYKAVLGQDTAWAEVEKRIGISETRRKQFVSLLNLPDPIQNEIVAIGKRPAKNQITEKHARALLMLKKTPEKQIELFCIIKKQQTTITGDQAIEMAKRMKGQETLQLFKLRYRTEIELIEKLEAALSALKKS